MDTWCYLPRGRENATIQECGHCGQCGALCRLENGARVRTPRSNGLFRISDVATLQGSIKGTTSFARESDVYPSSRGVCQAVLLVNSRRTLAVSVRRQRQRRSQDNYTAITAVAIQSGYSSLIAQLLQGGRAHKKGGDISQDGNNPEQDRYW